MKTNTLTALVGLLAAFVVGTNAADSASKASAQHPVIDHLSGLKGAEFDHAYVAHMIHHHQQGVEMAKLVGSQGEMPELKQVAQNIISTQGKEIEKLTGWLKEWANKTPADYPMPEVNKKKMQEGMARLKQAKGAEFDQLFLTQMIHHHQDALAMSELAKDHAGKEVLKEFAHKLIKDQSKEIEHMHHLQKP